jgi:hypothetical protein
MQCGWGRTERCGDEAAWKCVRGERFSFFMNLMKDGNATVLPNAL